jgi:aminopeptidase N
VIARLWDGRSYSIGEALARGLFPAPLADRRLVSASQQWLEAHPEPTALRRVIVENAAAVQRALAAQARDARD